MTEFAKLKVHSESVTGWSMTVELNGVKIPCHAIEFKADVHGITTATISFPAVIDMDVALETGNVVIRQDAFKTA